MRNAFILVVATLAAALVIAGCAGKNKKSGTSEAPTGQAEAVPVSTSLVTQRHIRESVDATGTLKAANEVMVGSRGPGKITFIIGKSGTPVRRGQVVARIDDTDAKIQLQSASAAVRGAQARLEQAKAAFLQQRSATDAGIINARAAVSAAKARLQQAASSYTAQKITAEAQVAQATQSLNAAKSRLAGMQSGARSQERQIAENSVRLAEATYNNDVQTRDRYRQLFESGAISRATLDACETKVQVSRAQLDSARQNEDLVKAGAREEDLGVARAAVQQAQAALDSANAGMEQVNVARDNVAIAKTGVEQAEAALTSAEAAVNLNTMRDRDVAAAAEAVQQAIEMKNTARQAVLNTQILSPVDGVVQDQLTEVGQSIGANVAVLRLTTDSALFFEAQISELDAPKVRTGQAVLLSIDALQGGRDNLYEAQQGSAIAASVERIVPVVDARSRNFIVRVLVSRRSSLFPGMFARGKIITADHANAIAVPKSALVEKDGAQYVFLAGSDNVAHRQPVQLGASDDSYIQALSGVQVGERVITEGQQTLRDGDALQIVAEQSSPDR